MSAEVAVVLVISAVAAGAGAAQVITAAEVAAFAAGAGAAALQY